MWTLPGVYRPQADTRLLLRALRGAGLGRGARVLDLCTGTGVAAAEAARCGAGEVIAVDTYLPAVLSAWLNTRGLPARVRRGDLTGPLDGAPFDLVLANPPYVPCASARPARGAARAWDAGPDGRRFLDVLCERAVDLMTPGGTMLVVHSDICGVALTCESLRETGLKSSVVARAVEPFGPVLAERAAYLTEAGFIEPGQRYEELVVIRADRIEP
ncbi:MAG TPA: methyltransferase [Amycolatopsis sp.]|nr:methyltransferase [Amycolatopsis sp.]